MDDYTRLLGFPEELALQLFEAEYEIFYSVQPLAYANFIIDQFDERSHDTSGIGRLVDRFTEVQRSLSKGKSRIHLTTHLQGTFPLFRPHDL